MKTALQSDWAALIGAEVEVKMDGKCVRSGLVDDAMPDSSIIWLAADHRNPRTLYEAQEGYRIWAPQPKQNNPASLKQDTQKAPQALKREQRRGSLEDCLEIQQVFETPVSRRNCQ